MTNDQLSIINYQLSMFYGQLTNWRNTEHGTFLGASKEARPRVSTSR